MKLKIRMRSRAGVGLPPAGVQEGVATSLPPRSLDRHHQPLASERQHSAVNTHDSAVFVGWRRGPPRLARLPPLRTAAGPTGSRAPDLEPQT